MLWDDPPLHPKEKPNQPHHLQLQLQHLHHCLLLSLLLTSASFENKCFEAGVFGFPGSEPGPSACWVGLRCKVIQWPGQSHTQSAGQSTLCSAHTHVYTYTHTHMHTKTRTQTQIHIYTNARTHAGCTLEKVQVHTDKQQNSQLLTAKEMIPPLPFWLQYELLELE